MFWERITSLSAWIWPTSKPILVSTLKKFRIVKKPFLFKKESFIAPRCWRLVKSSQWKNRRLTFKLYTIVEQSGLWLMRAFWGKCGDLKQRQKIVEQADCIYLPCVLSNHFKYICTPLTRASDKNNTIFYMKSRRKN